MKKKEKEKERVIQQIKKIANDRGANLTPETDELINKIISRVDFEFEIVPKGEIRLEEYLKRIYLESDRIDGILQDYHNAIAEIENNENLTPREKLNKYLPSLLALQEICLPHYLDRHQFINEAYIDLDKELDLENLKNNTELYSIMEDSTAQVERIANSRRILDTKGRNIYLDKEYSEKVLGVYRVPIDPSLLYWSVRDIYEYWLPRLDQDRIKSDDLLHQILVCYTIKRALNEDENAINKLNDLYKKGVTQRTFITNIQKLLSYQLYREREQKLYKQYRKYYPDEEAKERAAKKIGEFDSYISIPIESAPEFSSQLDEMDGSLKTEMDIEQNEESEEKQKHHGEIMTKSISNADIEQYALAALWLIITGFNPKSLINSLLETTVDFPVSEKVIDLFNTYFLDYHRVVLAEGIHSLNPYTLINAGLQEINSFCYRPNKMGRANNLTIWLFGPKKSPHFGKVYQMVRDHFLPDARYMVFSQNIEGDDSEYQTEDTKEQDYRRSTEYRSISKDYDAFKDRALSIPQNPDIVKAFRDTRRRLKQAGMSQRNIDIYFFSEHGDLFGLSQKEISEKFSISDRQVRNIRSKVRQILDA